MIKNIKKGLTATAIASMAVCVALLIGSVFGLSTFEGLLLKVLLTFAVIAISCAVSINAVSLLTKTKIVPYICLTLLASITIIALILIWTGLELSSTFGNATVTLAIATILFIIIVNFNTKLGQNLKLLQGITYFLIIAIDILLTLEIWGVNVLAISGVWQVFAVVCLGTFAMLCTLGILGKKVMLSPADEDVVKIKKSKYDELLKRIKILEEENAELKKLTIKK